MSWIDQFIQAAQNSPIASHVSQAFDSATPGMAIGEKVVQNPQQFAMNAAGGAGNMIKSTLGIPGDIYNSVKNGTEGTDLQNLAKGMINQYVNIAKSPSQAFYNDPVGTSAAVAPLVGLAGKLGTTEAADAGEAASSELPAIDNQELPGGNSEEIPDNAAQTFNSRYTVPTKRAGANDLNTLQTSKELLAHVKGGMDINALDTAPDFVTGENGRITDMTREAVGNIPGEVSMGTPEESASSILDSNKVYIDDATRNNVLGDIRRGQEMGTKPLVLAPDDAYDWARQLESKAADARRMSTYLTPNIKMEKVAQAYDAAADDIMDQIDTAGKGVPIESVKTPERMAELQQFSPRLAAQVKKAPDVSDLRSTAKPFVRLSKMQELNNAAQNSTFGKVAAGMQKPPIQPLAGTGAGIGGAIAGVPGAAVGYTLGNVADRVFSPEYGGLLNKIEAPLQDMMLQKRLGGAALPSIGSGAKAAALSLPAIGEGIIAAKGGNQPESPEQNQNNNSNSLHAATVSNSNTPVKPGLVSQPGKYSLASPQDEGLAMSTQDYTDKVTRVQQIIEQEKLNNPQQAAIDQGKLNVFQTKYQTQQPLVTTYQNTNTVFGQANNAYTIAKDASPNILQLNGSFDSLRKQTDPKYASLLGALQYLQKTTGVDLQSSKNKQTLLANIDQAVSIAKTQYDAVKQTFLGGNTLNESPNATKTNLPPIAPQAGQPSEIGMPVHYNFNFGSAGQNLPAIQ